MYSGGFAFCLLYRSDTWSKEQLRAARNRNKIEKSFKEKKGIDLNYHAF